MILNSCFSGIVFAKLVLENIIKNMNGIRRLIENVLANAMSIKFFLVHYNKFQSLNH